MQEAWVHAMQLNRNKDYATNLLNAFFQTYHENFLKKYNNGNNVEKLKGRVLETIINLASKSDQALGSISRRDRAFKNYVSRNRKSLLPNFFVEREMNCGRNVAKPAKKIKLDSSRSADLITCENIDHLIDEVAEIVYKILSTKTNEVYSEGTRSISTKDEESADGQLHLLTKVRDDEIITKLYGKLIPPVQENPLYVVHRLDCETSGIMVFARTATAASILSKSWRDRDRVVKKYVARVKHWPPFEAEGETSGSIHLAMAPMDSERIKWEIKDESKGGKPCETLWKLRLEEKTHDFITLELTPITGRTHQLRVHCAAIGSGIIGDSLYGESPIKLDEEASYFEKPSQILRLHAESLSFPHPSSGIVKTFICEHHWRDE
jgi:tRNA pseudouridine32 synthase/23S rRNA pseudouridine746 synthase